MAAKIGVERMQEDFSIFVRTVAYTGQDNMETGARSLDTMKAELMARYPFDLGWEISHINTQLNADGILFTFVLIKYAIQ